MAKDLKLELKEAIKWAMRNSDSSETPTDQTSPGRNSSEPPPTDQVKPGLFNSVNQIATFSIIGLVVFSGILWWLYFRYKPKENFPTLGDLKQGTSSISRFLVKPNGKIVSS